MPKSKVRKKELYTPPPERRASAKLNSGPSHPLYVVVMLGLMLLGLAWLVLYYLARNHIQFLADLDVWNFAIGFGLMVIGLVMTMRWR